VPHTKNGGLKKRPSEAVDETPRFDAVCGCGLISTFSLIFTCERETSGSNIASSTTFFRSVRVEKVDIPNLVKV
jgi:hypothetical protein